MISLSFVLLWSAFLTFYHSSTRLDKLERKAWELWLRKHPKLSRSLGTALLLGSMVLMIFSAGLAAGMFFWCIALMLFGSLILLLRPLRIHNTFALCILLTSVLIEFC